MLTGVPIRVCLLAMRVSAPRLVRLFTLSLLPLVTVAQTVPAPPATQTAAAQTPGQASAAAFSKEQLEQLVAPIALYPDSLLSQVLMAATYPADVAEAATWSKANKDQKGDAAVKAVQDQAWDPAVKALAAFPQVLQAMGDSPIGCRTSATLSSPGRRTRSMRCNACVPRPRRPAT